MDVFDFLHCSEVIDGVLLVGRVMMFVALYTLYAVLILVNISLFVACLVYSMCTVFLVMHGAGLFSFTVTVIVTISIIMIIDYSWLAVFICCLCELYGTSQCDSVFFLIGYGWMNGWMLMYKQISILCIPFMFCHIWRHNLIITCSELTSRRLSSMWTCLAWSWTHTPLRWWVTP